MPQDEIKTLTLMFVDIASLQTVRAAEGAGAAREFLDRCIGIINACREQHDGTLIRTVGGTVLCSFEDPAQSLAAANAMHKAVDEAKFATKTRALLRMGLHTGEVTIRDGSCSGEVVTTTARMVTLAQPGQTVATTAVRDGVPDETRDEFYPLPNAESMEARLGVKLFQVGKSHLISGMQTAGATLPMDSAPKSEVRKKLKDKKSTGKLARVTPIPASAKKRLRKRPIVLQEIQKKGPADEPKSPKMRPVPKEREPAPEAIPPAECSTTVQLCIIWRDKVLYVNSDNPSISLGRDEGNDIALTVRTASRNHAEVVMRGKQFFLVDHSGNGTFVYDEQGEEGFVNQGEAELAGSGAICAGCPQEEAGCEALLFWIADR